MITAGALHASLGIVGVTQLLRDSPASFTALRWCGAAVLGGWGMAMLWGSFRPTASNTAADTSGATSGAAGPRQRGVHPYWQGLLCTGTNPKVGLFLLAFLPQFVPAGTEPGSALIFLATVYLSLGVVWLATLVELVHRVRGRLARPRALRGVQRITAVVFIGFALRTALVA
jgi:threonine/homoserine/homoserine lactone efflux protein